MTTQHVIVSFSIGTAALSIGLICILLLGVPLGMLLTAPAKPRAQPSIPILIDQQIAVPDYSNGAIGEMKEAKLNKQYGPVNQDALHEVKEGFFSRMRARRSACSSPSMNQSACMSRPSYQMQANYRSSCQPCNQRPTMQPSWPANSQPLYQPVEVQEPMPQIDPSTCHDGSCALRNGNSNYNALDSFQW